MTDFTWPYLTFLKGSLAKYFVNTQNEENIGWLKSV